MVPYDASELTKIVLVNTKNTTENVIKKVQN